MHNDINEQTIIFNIGQITMKYLLFTVLVTCALILSLNAHSQVTTAREEACHSDVDLIDSTVEIIQSGTTAIPYLSSQEKNQVGSLLGQAENSEGATRDRLLIVLEACSDGRILQQRYNNSINAQ